MGKIKEMYLGLNGLSWFTQRRHLRHLSWDVNEVKKPLTRKIWARYGHVKREQPVQRSQGRSCLVFWEIRRVHCCWSAENGQERSNSRHGSDNASEWELGLNKLDFTQSTMENHYRCLSHHLISFKGAFWWMNFHIHTYLVTLDSIA